MTDTVSIEIPADVLDSARMTPDDIKLELALHLYAQRKLSIGKARELAGLSLWQFRQMLGMRKISPNYDVAEFEKDIETLQRLGMISPHSDD